jgi:glycosyltransferase involved in cell wall biosynthesis
MSLTVLSVAYPLAPVRPDTPGGAEQVLGMLDAALVRAGHHSIVVASEDSMPAGTLVATPRIHGPLDAKAERLARDRHRAAVEQALALWPVDLIHMHGQDFLSYLPPPGVPVIATLHVPREWYGSDVLRSGRPATYLHCVSAAQRRTWPADFPMLPEIENGVDVARLSRPAHKRRFALALGRMCPEKGFHIALDAAANAGLPLVIGGEVFRYEAHEHYFEREIAPRLGTGSRFIGRVGFARKRRLLSAAQCLLCPSLAAETSSLVAMEALACGTPVVAFPSGALAEIVEHGVSGYLVSNLSEMTEAICRAAFLDPTACRVRARERFSADRAIGQYLRMYEHVVEDAFRAANH